MAGDWIKMRCDLHTDPSVIGVAHDLGLDAFAVVGRLHYLWSWINLQTKNGIAAHVTATWLDNTLCCKGFAEILQKHGWLDISESGLRIPRFNRHNGKSAKDRALRKNRMKRLRGARSATTAPPEKRREEKRRIEKKNNPPYPPKGELWIIPESLDSPDFRTAWDEFAQHRREIKKPLTATSAKRQLATLESWGHDRAIAAIHHSIAHGWRGVFEDEVKDAKKAKTEETIEEKVRRIAREQEQHLWQSQDMNNGQSVMP